MWALWNLTLIGKIQVVNTLVISQLIYVGSVLNMPEIYVKQCRQMIKEFIWNKKPPKVKYNSLINTIQEGGLRLQDIECKLNAIKIKWIKNMLDEDVNAPWKSYLGEKLGGNVALVPLYNFNENEYPVFSDNFYNE